MKNGNTFFEKIKQKSDKLSPKQAQLAKYIMDNYKKAAFQNLTQIAKEADVSESTVVRLSTTLDYSGFIEMSNDLQDIVQHELKAYDSIRNTLKGENLKELNILLTVINNDQKNMDTLVDSVSMQEIEEVVARIEESNKVIVVGLYSSSYMAEYLGYTLGKVKTDVVVINKDSMDAHNLILACDEKTTVIMLSFPRYPKHLKNLGEAFRNKGATIIGITDSVFSPLKVFTDKLLIVPLKYMSFSDPCGPILLLLQAIIVEYVARNPEDTEHKLKQFDEYANQINLF
ncbi:hypothetical protein SYNTR_1776 [Candidatus Syntrophocurvum alkaliphilum]|uniref:Transcriptional regulator, RpiR family n=1 Tax=Candidatus Syntrophocurvum alkaliphilum TaxID=2293317 RepID=A0A6I6DK28_9FIRM|nr:MurR/RpiR family transcriptional regulator [Candidatus Syntrophocurvum alkaliphilum]QGU00370.1 hypothetical protein SYNTR_1776 [Candidatus Syntrophocurvum alkaliphilum]